MKLLFLTISSSSKNSSFFLYSSHFTFRNNLIYQQLVIHFDTLNDNTRDILAIENCLSKTNELIFFNSLNVVFVDNFFFHKKSRLFQSSLLRNSRTKILIFSLMRTFFYFSRLRKNLDLFDEK